ncbi:thiamine biosynthesis protein [Corynebacterium crudilactis]|uniref:Thiamine biosynthesis protein n=1 Tax=Corynebacterium crudilactis TaxID=1652495 RepID=A0A172QV87_9CORY|nr:thiamine biosynthesis protein [Corynebacterium crudilactis]ANE04561.1 thiamine biosynthesis protein [Corynebacterium crudilactis]
MSISRTIFGITAVATLSVSLVACAPPNQQDSTIERSNEVLITSQSPTTTSSITSTTPPVAENVAISVAPSELVDGEQITFEITGLNPGSGYYAAICATGTPTPNTAPMCTGETPGFSSQAWLNNSQPSATAAISDNGTATVEITAVSTGTGIDCTTQECVAKVFGDETEGFRHVAETPVVFAAA